MEFEEQYEVYYYSYLLVPGYSILRAPSSVEECLTDISVASSSARPLILLGDSVSQGQGTGMMQWLAGLIQLRDIGLHKPTRSKPVQGNQQVTIQDLLVRNISVKTEQCSK